MESCCYADDYGGVFGRRAAERDADDYLRRGLSGTAAVLAAALRDAGVDDATILEVGGGVGGLHVDLLRAGAGTAVNVDLSPEWEQPARRVLDEFDLAARVDRRVGDVVAVASDLAPADVVVAHRVVCCYPAWHVLLAAIADRAGRLVGLTVPRDTWWTRSGVAIGNAMFGLGSTRFRAFVHPVAEMCEELGRRGFGLRFENHGLVWQTMVMERTTT